MRYFNLPTDLNNNEVLIYFNICKDTNFTKQEYNGLKKYQFLCSLRNLEKDTGLNRKTISKILKDFEDKEYIQLIEKGKPPKTPSKYLLRFAETIENTKVTIKSTIKETIGETIQETMKPIDTTSVEGCSETIKETIEKPLSKPSTGTLSKHISKHNLIYTIPYSEILKYLNEKAGKRFTTSNSNCKLIKARWNDLKNLNNEEKLNIFKAIIDMKVKEWNVDGKTFSNGKSSKDYLRPATLFADKNFQNYLGELPSTNKVQQKVSNDFDFSFWGKER